MQIKKLTKIGGSIGLVLPKAFLNRLKLRTGDTVYLVDTPNGFTITAYNPDFEQQLEAARKVMAERLMVLQKLAN